MYGKEGERGQTKGEGEIRKGREIQGKMFWIQTTELKWALLFFRSTTKLGEN